LPLISFVPGEVVGWPRVSASCEYRAPLRYGDQVEVRLFVKEIRTRAVVFLFQFRRVVDGQVQPQVAAQGEIAAVCVTGDGAGGMVAQPIPAAVRAKLDIAPPAAWGGA
jgi:acyl-CoA thioesterase FadM